MSLEKLVEQAMENNPVEMKETFEALIEERITLALQEKAAKKAEVEDEEEVEESDEEEKDDAKDDAEDDAEDEDEVEEGKKKK
jgi:hypothetical protein